MRVALLQDRGNGTAGPNTLLIKNTIVELLIERTGDRNLYCYFSTNSDIQYLLPTSYIHHCSIMNGLTRKRPRNLTSQSTERTIIEKIPHFQITIEGEMPFKLCSNRLVKDIYNLASPFNNSREAFVIPRAFVSTQ